MRSGRKARRVRSGRKVTPSVRLAGDGADPPEVENWLNNQSSVPLGQRKTEESAEGCTLRSGRDGAVMKPPLTSTVA